MINNVKKTHLFAAMVLGFGISNSALANDKMPVVASFSILGDLVSEVGGNHVDITTLVKANGDAHVYSPTPKDAQALKHAKVLFVNGLAFEGWMPRLVEAAKFNGTTVVASNGITVIKMDEEDHDEHEADEHDHDAHEHEEHDHEGHHHHAGLDPHAWNSIANVKFYVKNIAKGLSKADPRNSNDYQKNATVYLAKLDTLEVKLHAQINTIPAEQRKIITPHDAFSYFSRDFNVTFIAPQGTSTESEASASDVADIIKQIRKDKIGAVFFENIADNRIIEQIGRETNAKIGGELFTDALSEASGPASTYLKMVQYNVTTIVNALAH